MVVLIGFGPICFEKRSMSCDYIFHKYLFLCFLLCSLIVHFTYMLPLKIHHHGLSYLKRRKSVVCDVFR